MQSRTHLMIGASSREQGQACVGAEPSAVSNSSCLATPSVGGAGNNPGSFGMSDDGAPGCTLGLPMGACSMVSGGSIVVEVGPAGQNDGAAARSSPPPWLISSAVECS